MLLLSNCLTAVPVVVPLSFQLLDSFPVVLLLLTNCLTADPVVVPLSSNYLSTSLCCCFCWNVVWQLTLLCYAVHLPYSSCSPWRHSWWRGALSSQRRKIYCTPAWRGGGAVANTKTHVLMLIFKDRDKWMKKKLFSGCNIRIRTPKHKGTSMEKYTSSHQRSVDDGKRKKKIAERDSQVIFLSKIPVP